MKDAINWLEIPVMDLDRARTFYERLLEVELKPHSMNGAEMAIFPYGEDRVGGALVRYEGFRPGADGPMAYLNAGEDLRPALGRVDGAGGEVLMDRELINEQIGYMAIFRDTEGNRVALHSPR